jgi:uncharacterized protein YbbC (DUF1343 family)
MRINYCEIEKRLANRTGTFALLTMQATSTTGRLMAKFPTRFKALFSAEHGFFCVAAAGERTASAWHPYWDRPIHSLYGEHRKPTVEMLEGIDHMVVDLCDIGVRCYTYLATLKLTLEACAEAGISVTVLDRPLPLGGILDGPLLKGGFSSFVAPMNVPLCHAMTPGECACWIVEQYGLQVDLDVVKVLDWSHSEREPWLNFIPPSPAIRSWDSAVMYPMTVFTEAYPAVDCDRGGSLAFRVVGAPWLNQAKLIQALSPGLRSCGVAMRPYRYRPQSGSYRDMTLDGILFSVCSPEAFYPVTAGMLLLSELVGNYGEKVFAGGRDEWFDKLNGTDEARKALLSGDLTSMFGKWIEEQDVYCQSKVDLYGKES